MVDGPVLGTDKIACWTLLNFARVSLGETNTVPRGHPCKGDTLDGFWSWHGKNFGERAQIRPTKRRVLSQPNIFDFGMLGVW